MIPIDQTIFGDRVGNCFAACIASVLELPLEDVPNFCAIDPDGDWFLLAHGFCSLRGYGLAPYLEGERTRELSELAEWLSIASGPSPRGDFLHSVLYRGNVMIHDPHPSRAGLAGGPVDRIVFVAIEPKGGKYV